MNQLYRTKHKEKCQWLFRFRITTPFFYCKATLQRVTRRRNKRFPEQRRRGPPVTSSPRTNGRGLSANVYEQTFITLIERGVCLFVHSNRNPCLFFLTFDPEQENNVKFHRFHLPSTRRREGLNYP